MPNGASGVDLVRRNPAIQEICAVRFGSSDAEVTAPLCGETGTFFLLSGENRDISTV